MGSTKYVMPEAMPLIGNPAESLAEFVDVFVRSLEKGTSESRRSLIEKVAKATSAPETLMNMDGSDLKSYFRNLIALAEDRD